MLRWIEFWETLPHQGWTGRLLVEERYNSSRANAEDDMEKPRFPDKYDWHGCDAVQFDPEKLGGRATVEDMRMDADSVLDNFEDGMTVDDIVESYGLNRQAVLRILSFAAARGLKATA
jgi:uncharacterized protein (DUF433 family)